jgi:HemY protein
MRFGIWALVALIVGAFGAHFLLQDRGYVLISFLGWNVEMSVPGLALMLILFYVAVRVLIRILMAPGQIGDVIEAHRTRRAGSRLARGLIHMTEGDFRRGERLLTDRLKDHDAKVVNYLIAARAADAQGSIERRDEWLRLAGTSDPKAEIAVLLTQAELEIKRGEPGAALVTLARVEKKKPNLGGTLALRAEALLQLRDRAGLAEILPQLARAKLDPDRHASILARALEAMRPEQRFDRAALKAVWSPLPLALRRRPRLIRARALLLDRLGRGEEALKSVAAALKRDWDRELVNAYGEIRSSDSLKQLQRAETWLKQRPEDPALLIAAARLSIANELWGKARSYLETTLSISPEPAAYVLYGELLERLGELDEAARAWRSGLRLTTRDAGRLPEPKAPVVSEA